MSGGSYTDTCPRCGGLMDCYSDTKPHDIADGVCLDCGYAYATMDRQVALKEVNELRVERELEPLEKFREPLPEWVKIYGNTCAGCGELIKIGESVYAIQSGYIDGNGEFVRTDCQSQFFHTGKCLNSGG